MHLVPPRSIARALAPWALAVALLAPGRARADEPPPDKMECIKSAEAAQKHRIARRIVEARASFLVCAKDGCPPVVRDDCREWLTEVETAVSSVVVRASDVSGKVLENVRVRIDGVVVAERLDGHPILVNPGEHWFEYDVEGAPKVRERVMVVAAEKNRVLAVAIATGTPPPPGPGGGAARAGGEPPVQAGPGVPTLAWVLYGVSGATLGAFAILGATGYADAKHLEDTCKDACDPKDVSAIRTRLIVGDVSLGVSLLAAGVATWLVLSPRRPATPAATGLSVDVLRGGGGLRFVGTF